MNATGCKRQRQLASYLGISPSTVSNLGKQDALPASWLLTALQKSGLNPEWIQCGTGPKFLAPLSGQDPDDIFPFALKIVLHDTPRLLAQLDTTEMLGEVYRRSFKTRKKQR